MIFWLWKSCITNYKRDNFFFTTSLIGSINDRILLTNQQVVPMGLNQNAHCTLVPCNFGLQFQHFSTDQSSWIVWALSEVAIRCRSPTYAPLYSVRISQGSRSKSFFVCDFLKNAWLLQQSVTIGSIPCAISFKKILWPCLQFFTR